MSDILVPFSGKPAYAFCARSNCASGGKQFRYEEMKIVTDPFTKEQHVLCNKCIDYYTQCTTAAQGKYPDITCEMFLGLKHIRSAKCPVNDNARYVW